MTPQIDGLGDLVEVGRGGFGVVYRARDTQFSRQVAVKVLNVTQASSDTESRFVRECQALGALSGHPNIVAVYQSGSTEQGQLYLTMEFLSGGTASDRVHDTGPADPVEILEWGTVLAGALETAHRAGIVHRDVKPANIIFSSFGAPKLVDFGIARMNNAFETSTGNVTATLNHAAPEVLEGRPASPAADIYALSSTLHQLLTGYAPFHVSGETSLAPLISRITTMPAPDLRQFGVPGPIAAVIARGLSKRAEDRYSSAGEMGEALRSAARELGVHTTPLPIASGSDIAEAARIERSRSPYEHHTPSAPHPAVRRGSQGGQPFGGVAGPGIQPSPHVSAPTPMNFLGAPGRDAPDGPGGPGASGGLGAGGPAPRPNGSSGRAGSGSPGGNRGRVVAAVVGALAVVGIIVGIVLATNGGGDQPAADPTSSTWTQASPTTSTTNGTRPTSSIAAPPAQTVQLGQAIHFTDGSSEGTLTVNKVEWLKSNPGELGGARNGYLLLLNVTQRTTKGSVEVNSLNFSIIDSKGQKKYTTLLLAHDPHLQTSTLTAGQSQTGNIGFDIAKQDVTVSLNNDLFQPVASVRIPG